MTWRYHCHACGMNMPAAEKRELIMKVMRHMNEAHQMNLSYEQAQEVIERDATVEASDV